MIAGALALLVAAGPRSFDPGANDVRAELQRLVALAGLACFGPCLALTLRLALREGPALIIDEEGFVDRIAWTAVGRVRWPDVAAVRVVKRRHGVAHVAIDVRDPHAFTEALPRVARWAARRRLDRGGAAVELRRVVGFEQDLEKIARRAAVSGGPRAGRALLRQVEALSEPEATVVIDLAPGDRVRVRDGSFEGIEGTVHEALGEKVRVLLPFFGRVTPVDLEATRLEKV
jgi:transcription antitermination factor NusG